MYLVQYGERGNLSSESCCVFRHQGVRREGYMIVRYLVYTIMYHLPYLSYTMVYVGRW